MFVDKTTLRVTPRGSSSSHDNEVNFKGRVHLLSANIPPGGEGWGVVVDEFDKLRQVDETVVERERNSQARSQEHVKKR